MRRLTWAGYAFVGTLALLLDETASLSNNQRRENGIHHHLNNYEENSVASIIQYIESLESSITSRKPNDRALPSIKVSNESHYVVFTSKDTLADAILNIVTFIETLENTEQRAVAYIRLINIIAETDDTVVTPKFLSLISSVFKESYESYKTKNEDFYTVLYSADELSPGQRALIYVLLYTKCFVSEEVQPTAMVLALKVRELFVCCDGILRGYLKSLFKYGFPGRIKVLTEDRPFMMENVQHVGFRMNVNKNDSSSYNLAEEEYKWKWKITLVENGYVLLESWDGLKLYCGESTGVEEQRYVGVSKDVGEEGQWRIETEMNGSFLVFRNRKYGLGLDSNALIQSGSANAHSNVYAYRSTNFIYGNPYVQWHVY